MVRKQPPPPPEDPYSIEARLAIVSEGLEAAATDLKSLVVQMEKMLRVVQGPGPYTGLDDDPDDDGKPS